MIIKKFFKTLNKRIDHNKKLNLEIRVVDWRGVKFDIDNIEFYQGEDGSEILIHIEGVDE